MKYLVSIILFSVLIACNSLNSETILHNDILNGSVSHIYESRYQVTSIDTSNNQIISINNIAIDSSLKLINRKGLETNHKIFSFQNNVATLVRESSINYENNIIKYGQDFYPLENKSLSFFVQEHNDSHRPTLIQVQSGENIVGFSKIKYNDKGLAIENIGFAPDNVTQTQQTITEYNDNNHVLKITSTNLSSGLVSTTTFEYLEYDEKGNWTSRKEYIDGNTFPILNYRKYEYH